MDNIPRLKSFEIVIKMLWTVFFSPLSPPISSESSEYLAANEANLSRDMFVFVFVGVRGTVPDSTSLNPTRPLSIKGFQIQPIRSLTV